MMKKLAMSFVALALLLGPGSFCAVAADSPAAMKPVAVVAWPSWDSLVSNTATLGELAGKPALDKILEGGVALVTQGKGLAGLDKTRPWGAVFEVNPANGRDFAVLGFIPVTDLKALLDVAALYDSVKDLGDGIFEVKNKKSPLVVFVKEQNGWAYVAQKRDQLAKVTIDPLALLGTLPKEYVVSARVLAGNAPADLREKLIAQIKSGAQKDAAVQKPGETDQDYAARKKVTAEAVRTIVALVNDLDQITLGWVLDRKAQTTSLDLTMTVREGTPTAAMVADVKDSPSQFAGFRQPGAAVTVNTAGKIPAVKIEMLSTVIAAVRSHAIADIEKQNKPADETSMVKEVVDAVAGSLQKTVKTGRMDVAMTALLAPDAATGMAGAYLADASTLDRAYRKLVEFVKEKVPQVAGMVTLDAEKAGGVTFHTISAPIHADAKTREKIVRLVGENLQVAVGFGGESAYFGIGREPLAALKKAIAASAADTARTVRPLEATLDLEKIMSFVAVVGEGRERAQAAMAANELKKTPSHGHVRLTVQGIPHGVRYRFEVESGVLKAVGAVATKQK
jgi:hypothetical protein